MLFLYHLFNPAICLKHAHTLSPSNLTVGLHGKMGDKISFYLCKTDTDMPQKTGSCNSRKRWFYKVLTHVRPVVSHTLLYNCFPLGVDSPLYKLWVWWFLSERLSCRGLWLSLISMIMTCWFLSQ